MNICKKFFSDTKYAIAVGIGTAVIAMLALTVFLIVRISVDIDTATSNVSSQISVSGEGEIVATPDIATFTFTVRETSEYPKLAWPRQICILQVKGSSPSANSNEEFITRFFMLFNSFASAGFLAPGSHPASGIKTHKTAIENGKRYAFLVMTAS